MDEEYKNPWNPEDEKEHFPCLLEWWCIISYFKTLEDEKRWSVKGSFSEWAEGDKEDGSIYGIVTGIETGVVTGRENGNPDTEWRTIPPCPMIHPSVALTNIILFKEFRLFKGSRSCTIHDNCNSKSNHGL